MAITYVLRCDLCEATIETSGTSAAEARRHAFFGGKVVRNGRREICRECDGEMRGVSGAESSYPEIRSLFRYRCLDTAEKLDRELADLHRNRLFFSNLSTLNDPQELFWGTVLCYQPQPSHDVEFAGSHLDKETRYFSLMSRWRSGEAERELRQRMHICCFTRAVNNKALWAHYACGHTGIAVSYNRAALDRRFRRPLQLGPGTWEPECGVFDVTYRKRALSIDVGNIHHNVTSILSSKDSSYAFEDEVRILHDRGGLIDVPADALEAVYLGCRITDAHRRRLVQEFSNRCPTLQFRLQAGSYGLVCEAI